VTSQAGGSAHKRGLVNPETGRIMLYNYRDFAIKFTVKVSTFYPHVSKEQVFESDVAKIILCSQYSKCRFISVTR
jgi:hypothetical protein